MKYLISILTAAVALNVSAADKPAVDSVGRPLKDAKAHDQPKAPVTPKQTASWIDSITVAPVGAIKTEHLDGPSQWSAGLNIGYDVNKFVKLQVVNLSFEGVGQSTLGRKTKKGYHTVKTGEDSWGGLLVDETDLQVDAKIARFSNETFSLHVVSGGQCDWNEKDYGINAGLKLVLDFSKRVNLSAGYSVRTWLKGETRVDSLTTAELGFRF